jgi:hypothetical protein
MHSFAGHRHEKDFNSRDAVAVGNQTQIKRMGKTQTMKQSIFISRYP